jgi:integral membrane sensor domain MASE1
MITLTPFGKKMQIVRFSWFLNIFLAVVIVLNAEAGRLLGIEELPLAVSAVWPPTGFSLAALLLFGYGTWPGIFFGNLVYNLIHLVYGADTIVGPLFVAMSVTVGSLLQALVAATIMRRFSTAGYFNTVRDVLIFLFPAGIAACLIASSIGVLALYLYGILASEHLGYVWMTFLLGDTLGVYIFTPLLVVWSLRRPLLRDHGNFLELATITAIFMLISYATFALTLPVALLYVPLATWVAYRFGMHGATVIVFLIALLSIVFTTLGYGLFFARLLNEPVLILTGYLEILVFSSLLIAAMCSERPASSYFIPVQEVDFEQIIPIHDDELKKLNIQTFIREKKVLLGLLTVGIASKIQVYLKNIDQIAKRCKENIFKIHKLVDDHKEKFSTETMQVIERSFEQIEASHKMFTKIDTQAHRTAKLVEEQVTRAVAGKTSVQFVNVNSLLRKCLIQVSNEQARRFPGFTFTLVEDFDKEMKPMLALPEELSRAFMLLLHNALFSMQEKIVLLGAKYTPVLEVRTIHHESSVEVVLRDNGKSFTERELKNFSQSFITLMPSEKAFELPEEGISLGITLASDIITYLHEGNIRVDSHIINQGEEFVQLTILLPRPKL